MRPVLFFFFHLSLYALTVHFWNHKSFDGILCSWINFWLIEQCVSLTFTIYIAISPVLFMVCGVDVASAAKKSQTVLRTRQQSPVGLLTIWPTIPADLALTFYKGCLKLLLSFSLCSTRKRENGKLKLNFIAGCNQTVHNRYGCSDPNK